MIEPKKQILPTFAVISLQPTPTMKINLSYKLRTPAFPRIPIAKSNTHDTAEVHYKFSSWCDTKGNGVIKGTKPWIGDSVLSIDHDIHSKKEHYNEFGMHLEIWWTLKKDGGEITYREKTNHVVGSGPFHVGDDDVLEFKEFP